MRRFIFSSLVALPLALSLTACDSGDGGDSSGSESASSGEGTSGSGTASEGGDSGSSSAGDGGVTSAGEGDATSAEGDATTAEGDATTAEGDGTTAGDTDGSPESVCIASGGAWEPLSCGDYTCGKPPACEAIIPGCDCGEGSNFEAGVGCVEDLDCGVGVTTGGGDEATQCAETGGTWDETSCGHYKCGNIPDCDAIIPGCDCGVGASFKDGFGCAEDSTCG